MLGIEVLVHQLQKTVGPLDLKYTFEIVPSPSPKICLYAGFVPSVQTNISHLN